MLIYARKKALVPLMGEEVGMPTLRDCVYGRAVADTLGLRTCSVRRLVSLRGHGQ